ncbi:hypothetical protein ACFQDG_03950 [Natronoarchaeum mannanilyticum]|uniref:DUF2795 domain-containing protein n=1 Tax=Natronoarchaeum mannanilyticum TaxID=926360 RepID=A0AAV3T7B8_9EURY
MSRTTRLSRVEEVLAELDYPVVRADAADELSDVTLELADGEVNLGEIVSETSSDSFESAEELESDLNNALPREAVGEPYQSEGEG